MVKKSNPIQNGISDEGDEKPGKNVETNAFTPGIIGHNSSRLRYANRSKGYKQMEYLKHTFRIH